MSSSQSKVIRTVNGVEIVFNFETMLFSAAGFGESSDATKLIARIEKGGRRQRALVIHGDGVTVQHGTTTVIGFNKLWQIEGGKFLGEGVGIFAYDQKIDTKLQEIRNEYERIRTALRARVEGVLYDAVALSPDDFKKPAKETKPAADGAAPTRPAVTRVNGLSGSSNVTGTTVLPRELDDSDLQELEAFAHEED